MIHFTIVIKSQINTYSLRFVAIAFSFSFGRFRRAFSPTAGGPVIMSAEIERYDRTSKQMHRNIMHYKCDVVICMISLEMYS